MTVLGILHETYLDNTLTPSRLLNVALGNLSRVEVPHGKHDALSRSCDKVSRRLEAQSRVAARYDIGLADACLFVYQNGQFSVLLCGQSEHHHFG